MLVRAPVASNIVISLTDYVDPYDVNFEEQVQAFIRNKMDLSMKGRYGETLLHVAARLDKRGVIELLREQGAEYLRDDLGYMPWHTAAAFGSVDAMQFFIRYTTVSDKVSTTGMTLLHMAAMMVHTGIVKMVIEAGIMDMNQADNLGATPLIMAIFYKREATANILLEANVDLSVGTNLCITPSGVASFFLPQICPRMFNRILNLRKKGQTRKERLDYYSTHLTSVDRKILYLAGYSTKKEAIKTLLTHPLIADLIKCLDYRRKWYHGLILYIMYGLHFSIYAYLCLLPNTNVLTMDKEKDLANFVLIIATVSYLILQFLIGQTASVLWQCRGIYGTGSEWSTSIKQITDILQQNHHPELHTEGCYRDQFIKKLKKIKICQIQVMIGACVLDFVFKVVVPFISVFIDYSGKEYVLSILLVIIFLHTGYYAVFFLNVPRSLIVNIICLKDCTLAVLEIFSLILLSFIPFFLVLMKFSIKEGMCFDDTYCNAGWDWTWDSCWNITFGAADHLIRVMMVDDYHSVYFESQHRNFLAFFYTVIMLMSCIVIINMSIAKLSMIYEDVTRNATYVILREKLKFYALYEHFKKSEQFQTSNEDPALNMNV